MSYRLVVWEMGRWLLLIAVYAIVAATLHVYSDGCLMLQGVGERYSVLILMATIAFLLAQTCKSKITIALMIVSLSAVVLTYSKDIVRSRLLPEIPERLQLVQKIFINGTTCGDVDGINAKIVAIAIATYLLTGLCLLCLMKLLFLGASKKSGAE